MKISFKATSTENAVNELLDKTGGKLGIDKVAAAEIVGEYEKKNGVTHGKGEEVAYEFLLPTENYTLSITSS
jgi:hypothetical protein